MNVDITGQPANPVTKLLNTYRENLLDFDMLQSVPEPRWLIDGVLMEDTIACLWSQPGAGKSFIVLDWSMSVATDHDWFGRKTKAGNVLYILGEGVNGMKQRANAWVAAHNKAPEGDQFLWLKRRIGLLEEHSVELVCQLAAEQGGAKLIIIDTLSRAIVGHNENDSTDMGRLVDVSEQIREQTKSTVLFVHHANTSAIAKMRGSSVINGAIDTQIELDYNEVDNSRTLHCRKQKDGPNFVPISVQMRKVDVDAHNSSLVPSPYTHSF